LQPVFTVLLFSFSPLAVARCDSCRLTSGVRHCKPFLDNFSAPLVSPVFVFVGSTLLQLLLELLIRKPSLFQGSGKRSTATTGATGIGKSPAVLWAILFVPCADVSFFRRANEGRKAMGWSSYPGWHFANTFRPQFGDQTGGDSNPLSANHSSLQMQTFRKIVLAWVLTLPVLYCWAQLSSPSRFTSFSISLESGKRSAGKTPVTIEVT
jgi:hypothetical protein